MGCLVSSWVPNNISVKEVRWEIPRRYFYQFLTYCLSKIYYLVNFTNISRIGKWVALNMCNTWFIRRASSGLQGGRGPCQSSFLQHPSVVAKHTLWILSSQKVAFDFCHKMDTLLQSHSRGSICRSLSTRRSISQFHRGRKATPTWQTWPRKWSVTNQGHAVSWQ